MATGKRHCFYYQYDVGFDDNGRILAAKIDMVLRAGYSTDLSPPVATRALCHFDNAYYLSDVSIKAMCGKTNTQSNTAFRGFGGPQGAIAIEYIIDDIARIIGRDPLDVRKHNFYGKTDRNITPYDKKNIRKFNRTSAVIKKGIALTPVKFGISFNLVHFNQAGALVHVYTDGSVLVNHGGTEMGQGLHTKVAQVVAATLLNGKAAEDAALQIRSRLAVFAAQQFGGKADDVAFADDQVLVNDHSLNFTELVKSAYEARIQLWSDGFYATPDLHWDSETLSGRPFYYFAYGAAVSEVAIDTLTGEWKLLRTDLLHDVGNSINEAVDIGQIEGGFIQGMGWLTLEQLVWNDHGKLLTHAPSTYKIPAVSDCPKEFRTVLYHNPNTENTIMRSKATGEPPLLLAFSVLFAIRDAVASVADYKVNPSLEAPATPEAILNSVTALQSQVAS